MALGKKKTTTNLSLHGATFPQTLGCVGPGNCSCLRDKTKGACYVTASGGCSLESFPFPFLMTA